MTLAAAGGVAAGLAVSLVLPPSRRARSAFIPRMEPFTRPVSSVRFRPPSGDRAVEIPSPEASEGPAFYRWLPRSEDVLREVAAGPFGPGSAASSAGPLEDVWGIEGPSRAERRRKAVEALRARVEAERSDETGVVRLTTVAVDPDLAVELNRGILDAVDAFIVEKRRERARRELELLRRLRGTARRELEASERAHRRFLERNRRYEELPGLRLREARLRRAREEDEARVGSLEVAIEERRAELVRETPMIAVVQEPALERAAGAGRIVSLGALGGLAGAAGAVALAAAGEWARRRGVREILDGLRGPA